jgi:hypothetical protein
MFGLDAGELAVLVVCLAAFGTLYALPSILAWHRRHPGRIAITALNLLLGWTLLGWVGALGWALSATPGRDGASSAP